MDPNGSGLLERYQLTQGLANFGIDVDDGPGGDIEKIMGFFDRHVVGRIIIHEFHRGLRVRAWYLGLARAHARARATGA